MHPKKMFVAGRPQTSMKLISSNAGAFISALYEALRDRIPISHVQRLHVSAVLNETYHPGSRNLPCGGAREPLFLL